MRKRKDDFRPPSLAQHFDPPEGFKGCFAWLCGYSADESFLDDAATRFMGRTRDQRANEGSLGMALMLDPRHRELSLTGIPGVKHLALKGVKAPFRLLHAKVAILGFQHSSEELQWHLRLIVSTGNWSRQTLEESLDLVFRVDLNDRELKARGKEVAQACADLRAAWDLLHWLRGHFDTRLLDIPAQQTPGIQSAQSRLEDWIREATGYGQRTAPRFFDNRNQSLLGQLPALLERHKQSASRNYLAMGSGFYEGSESEQQVPGVLSKIVSTFQAKQLLTQKPEVDVFVNPLACQAVAGAWKVIHDAGWKVRTAGQPEYFAKPRALHAKFLFSANHQRNSSYCNNAWLYMGSGNLTAPGFTNKMSVAGGNLEAGVVHFPESLSWKEEHGVPSDKAVTNLLPLQWKTDVEDEGMQLVEGGERPESEGIYCAAPVAYFRWRAEEEMGWLLPNEHPGCEFELLDGEGKACSRTEENGFVWLSARPREVKLRWRVEDLLQQAMVPVVDEFGRIAATVLPRMEIEEAWIQLANFPAPTEEEELEPDAYQSDPMTGPDQKKGNHRPGIYPVRQLMQLVENIAARQTTIARLDWAMWCTRLEQCLTQAKESAGVAEFLKLGINPLSPLWHRPFRPEFAEDGNSPEGTHYEKVLARVEKAWNVSELAPLGDEA